VSLVDICSKAKERRSRWCSSGARATIWPVDEAITPLSDARSEDTGSLTYEPHFGLREKAFSLSPDPRFFLRQSSHAKAFDALVAGIRRREGILALTGEVGTGKTTLCRSVLQSLDRKTFAAFVPDPILSREDLLKTLLVDFGVVSVDDIKTGRLRGASRTDLSYTLYEFLASLQPLKAFAVLMIDEAQNLPTTLLEEVRILSDMEHGEKLLQLVLIGQPELQARLSEPEMRQLRQRLSVRCKLDSLAPAEVRPYISHRLGIAGNGEVAFDEAAVQRIYEVTEGIPRVINLLSDRALLRAADAGASNVGLDHVIGAADDLCIPVSTLAIPPLEPEIAAVSPLAPTKQDAASRTHASRQGLPARYQMRHDAHYVEELDAHTLSGRGTAPAVAVDRPAVSQPASSTNEGAGKRLASLVAVAALGVILSAAGMWFVRSATTRTPEPAATISEQAAVEPVPKSTASRVDALPLPNHTAENASSVATSGPPAAPLSRAAAPVLPSAVSAAAGTPRFAVQMATFRTKARAIEAIRELGAAGYSAFSAEVGLRDGARAFTVSLGPYAERAAAAEDLERAQRTPGYGTGRIVQIDLPGGR
jgi:type II secretory pathway predicted ATPase ExeA